MLDLKLILTIRCEEASRLTSDGLDRKLTFSERLAVRAHTFICRSCRRFHSQMRMLRKFVDQIPTATRNRIVSASPGLTPERRREIERLLAEAANQDST